MTLGGTPHVVWSRPLKLDGRRRRGRDRTCDIGIERHLRRSRPISVPLEKSLLTGPIRAPNASVVSACFGGSGGPTVAPQLASKRHLERCSRERLKLGRRPREGAW